MSYEYLLYEVSEHIATITLNRPEDLNAYTPEMGDDIVAAFRHAASDDEVRAVIFTAAGDRAFCAGAHKKYLTSPLPEGLRVIGEEELITSFPLELARFPKPTIVAYNGHAVGIGMTMTLPCDMRIAVEGAKLVLNFSRLGILLGLGSTHLLPKIVGMARAQELVMTGNGVSAEQALEIGLVNYVVPKDKLLEKARELARQCAQCNPLTLTFAKRALHDGASLSLEQAMANEKAQVIALRKAKAENQSS